MSPFSSFPSVHVVLTLALGGTFSSRLCIFFTEVELGVVGSRPRLGGFQMWDGWIDRIAGSVDPSGFGRRFVQLANPFTPMPSHLQMSSRKPSVTIRLGDHSALIRIGFMHQDATRIELK